MKRRKYQVIGEKDMVSYKKYKIICLNKDDKIVDIYQDKNREKLECMMEVLQEKNPDCLYDIEIIDCFILGDKKSYFHHL